MDCAQATASRNLAHPECGERTRQLVPERVTSPVSPAFGNLIALPLQKGPRERGHSVFLDERLVPWDDQWSFLSRIRKVARAQVEQSQLEVDVRCADARVAIELDGAQHLADPVAYRRDRRKDQLLQENDYFLLRFLAEDVGKDLDLVLDAVLRVLGRRTQHGVRVSPLKVTTRPSS